MLGLGLFCDAQIRQTARSILFLKHVESVSFGILTENAIEDIATINISPNPSDFKDLLEVVSYKSDTLDISNEANQCSFERSIKYCIVDSPQKKNIYEWSFQTYHSLRFDDQELYSLRNKLLRNNEKAIPWASLAVPLNKASFNYEDNNGSSPFWRVFLPLLEEGPSSCVFSAALFVGPSRQRAEFVTSHGSDEALRKTNWNKELVERALVPLLRNASLDMLETLQEFIKKYPKDYLSLFPVSHDLSREPKNLTEYLQRSFSKEPWCLQIYDIWDEEIEIMVGDESSFIELEMIPEWLIKYRDCFENLSDDSRYFIPFSIGDAVNKRLSNQKNISISRDVSPDVAEAVLRQESPPVREDLVKLLKQIDLPEDEDVEIALDGLWCFVRAQDKQLLRYDEDYLYLSQSSEQKSQIHQCLQDLEFKFNQTEWIDPKFGIPATKESIFQLLENVVPADDSSALKLLSRIEDGSQHDRVSNANEINPIIDFLCNLDKTRPFGDLQLGFLVKTAHGKELRRNLGVILLKPVKVTNLEDALWEGIFRRTYAEVDPDFSKELNRLLSTRPDCLKMLHSPDCRVIVANEDSCLDIFHTSGEFCDDDNSLERLIDKVEEEMNGYASKKGLSEIISATIIEKADKYWDNLNSFQQDTILTLPIHRLATGKYIGIPSASAIEMQSQGVQFRLQSTDDLVDAPLTLPEFKLLHHGDRIANKFYRDRIKLEEHGRAAVLKETLQQIGSDDLANSKLLEYVAKYFEDTVELLKNSNEPGHKRDAVELEKLLESARLIICTDEVWRPIGQCKQSWDVAEKMNRQGWQRKELSAVLTNLFSPQAISSIVPQERKLIEKICELQAFDVEEIAKFAIISNSSNLSLAQRVKIVSDNWVKAINDLEVSEFLNSQPITTISGECKLRETKVLASSGSEFPKKIAKYFVPQAVDLETFTKNYSLSLSSVNRVLLAFGIEQVSSGDLKNIIITNFTILWPDITSSEVRLQLLSYVGQNEDLIEVLQDEVSKLDVACISIKKDEWVEPYDIVAPSWRITNPPLLPEDRLISSESTDDSVFRVWDKWCGLNGAEEIINEVIDAASELEDNKQKRGAKAFYNWFDKIIDDKKITSDELVELLDEHEWVLAQKADDVSFLEAGDVLQHMGGNVLRKEFWVPVCDLPKSLKKKKEVLGFQDTLAPDEDTVEKIGSCLISATETDLDALVSVYALTTYLLSHNDDLSDIWQEVAENNKVFSLFRNTEIKVRNIQLFIGNKDFSEDIGELLFCLKGTKKLPKKITSLYSKLGVEISPTANQLLWALSNLSGEYKAKKSTYEQLVDSLVLLKDSRFSSHAFDLNLKILSCANTLVSIDGCYLDDDLGIPTNIEKEGRKFLINGKDKATRKLINWLENNMPAKITRLRDVSSANIQYEPDEVEINPLVTQILGPWKDFIREVTREGSLLREELAEEGIHAPQSSVRVTAVNNLSIEFHLPEGHIVRQSDKWQGIPVYFDKRNNIFVQYSFMEKSKRAPSFGINELDRFIANEVLKCLIQDNHDQESMDNEVLIDLIINNLERPSNLLTQIRISNQRHFFHQYNDQVADPEFVRLFEQYRKTREGSSQHRKLAEEMEQILLLKNVNARRDDIRGYGYDEFSVFAELVQNAEDAYVQRDWLKMDDPPSYSVTFKYQQQSEVENLRLIVEHFGRPFNYWRHGAYENENLKRDVEGVLRSKGSYKPHGADSSDEKTIGRFGLGFKSVFLVTDRPIIHSDNWHFSIDACCLPNEMEPPRDLPQGATRIVLPLSSNDAEIEDRDGGKLVNLLPFLKKVDSLNLVRGDGSILNLKINPKGSKANGPTEFIVEKIHILGTSHIGENQICFLRFRHPDHDGQLAICISEEVFPVPWDEAFINDFFVVLPLKVKLGCGVAISHLFEIQSGRTHLIEHQENTIRIQEVSRLISAFPQALEMLLNTGNNLREILLHFWSLWRWDIGDSEGYELRKAIAKQLVLLAEENEVVPIQRDDEAVRVGDNVLFHFSQNIPDHFIDALIESNVEFQDSEKEEIPLTPDSVVPSRFAKSFIAICNFVEVGEPDNFVRITWEKVGEAFSESEHFAKFPDLFNTLAECLPYTQYENVIEWLPECRVRGVGGDGKRKDACPGELLLPAFPGIEKLPKHLLILLDTCYSEKAIELLSDAGLLDCPPVEQIQEWIENKALNLEECNGILNYLLEDGRFRTHYHSLKHSMSDQWIPYVDDFLTITEAKGESLLDNFLLEDDEFCAWLGLWERGEPGKAIDVDEIEEPEFDAQVWLEKLFDWWQINGTEFSCDYEQEIYPQGKPFDLNPDFFPSDRSARREWISLFLLGSFHTMGYYKNGAHRNFLSTCENKGWLQVFADPNIDATRWIDVLESYLDGQIGEAQYHHWVKQFVCIYQLARWLDGYVEIFLDMENYSKDFSINELLISRESIAQQRGGVDAPPLTKTLGIGANFVTRELLRNRVIEQQFAHRHCFVPIKRVRDIFARLGCDVLEERCRSKTDLSTIIYDFLVKNLGEDKAIFNHSFDLPFLAVADGKAPEWDLPPLFNEADATYRRHSISVPRDSGKWVTLSDGRKVKLSN